MRGLIIKDIFNLKKGIMTTLIVILMYGIFSYNTGEVGLLIGMTTLIISSMSISAMAYDDMAKWDSYALAMPITRKSVVLSRYILSFILSVTAIILSGAFSILITYLREGLISIENIQEILFVAYGVFLVSMLYTSIIIPLIYKFGVENARLLMIGSYFVPVGIGYILVKIGVQLPTLEQLKMILYISPIILALILILSTSISYGVYKKKDI